MRGYTYAPPSEKNAAMERGHEKKGEDDTDGDDAKKHANKRRFEAYWTEMKRRQRRLALERLAGRGTVKKKMIQKKLKQDGREIVLAHQKT